MDNLKHYIHNNDRLVDLLEETIYAMNCIDDRVQKDGYLKIIREISHTLSDNSTAISFELRKMNDNK